MKELCIGRRGILPALFVLSLVGCAVQTPPVTPKESATPTKIEQAAQKAVIATVTAPTLKRKIALGRISNETNYGMSLLRDRSGDPLGKQVTDMFSKALTESGAYLVFERPDINKLQAESNLTGEKLNLVGVDALIIGSLTEFGRKTIGESGFLSNSKRQVAFAKIDIRIVDSKTGLAFFATSGAGESSTESASTFGFGSQAGYDGTLNDSAIRQAVSEAINKLTQQMNQRPWQTGILSLQGSDVFVAGGKAQGITPGMTFSVQTPGRKVKSPQTGLDITLPGAEVAQLRIISNFGTNETDEGSVASISSGSLAGQDIAQLVVRTK